jgi:hypothetical protein
MYRVAASGILDIDECRILKKAQDDAIMANWTVLYSKKSML